MKFVRKLPEVDEVTARYPLSERLKENRESTSGRSGISSMVQTGENCCLLANTRLTVKTRWLVLELAQY